MFLGYQNDLVAFVSNTKKELENLNYIHFTKIEQTQEPVEMVCGSYYIGENNIKEAKEKDVRNYRNHLLETEVDPVVSNPLRWNDMSEYNKTNYQEYRTYLLDWTENEGWWESKPKTFDEFCTKDVVIERIEDIIPVDVDEE